MAELGILTRRVRSGLTLSLLIFKNLTTLFTEGAENFHQKSYSVVIIAMQI